LAVHGQGSRGLLEVLVRGGGSESRLREQVLTVNEDLRIRGVRNADLLAVVLVQLKGCLSEGVRSEVQTVMDLSSESAEEPAGEHPARRTVAAARVIAVASWVMRDFFIAAPL
jgi:hypothetical protein